MNLLYVFCVLSWLVTKIILRCTVSKTSKFAIWLFHVRQSKILNIANNRSCEHDDHKHNNSWHTFTLSAHFTTFSYYRSSPTRYSNRQCVILHPISIVQEAGWAPGPAWTGAENLPSTRIRSPDRPARSQLLYLLSYRAHFQNKISLKFLQWEPSSELERERERDRERERQREREREREANGWTDRHDEGNSRFSQFCYLCVSIWTFKLSLPLLLYYS